MSALLVSSEVRWCSAYALSQKIVKSGAAYVPLDPDHPADRLAYVLDVAQPAAVLGLSTQPLDLPAEVEVLSIDLLDLGDLEATPLTHVNTLEGLRALVEKLNGVQEFAVDLEVCVCVLQG